MSKTIPAPLAVGTQVCQCMRPIKGVVTDVKFVAESLSFEYCVIYKDADGETQQRWFAAADLDDPHATDEEGASA